MSSVHTPPSLFYDTHPHLLTLDEPELRALTDAAFRDRYAGTPLLRIGRPGLLQNLSRPTTPNNPSPNNP